MIYFNFNFFKDLFFYFYLSHSILGLITMSDRKNRFNLFNFKRNKNNLNRSDGKKKDNLGFPSFDSIIPENSPLKKDSNSSSGFFNDDLVSKGNSGSGFFNDDLVSKSKTNSDLDGVDEKYAKYIFSDESNVFSNSKPNHDSSNLRNSKSYQNPKGSNDENLSISRYGDGISKSGNDFNANGKLKQRLLNYKKSLLNKNDSSKTLFGKITFILIFLVLISSVFYFFVYQPFQSELNLERNAKLNEINALYKGPLEINDNAYSLKDRVNRAFDVEEIKSIDVLMSATKDWRFYHSSKIVDCKDDFGRVMMSYGDNKNIIMSVKDANDFVKDNDARILSNVQFEKVNTVIVPVSLSRLQATAGLISVGSVVDIYSLSDNSTEYDYMGSEDESMISNETDMNDSSSDGTIENEGLEVVGNEDSESIDEGPVVSGATVLAILRSKDSGIVDSTISRSNTIIKGNKTNPFENTSAYSSDVEEQLKASVLNSSGNGDALDSYLVSYGVRLSNFERLSNLGDLDSEYIILLEVPQGDVNFVINNMANLILTIPTDFAPNWVVGELNQTYYENLYPEQSLDFF